MAERDPAQSLSDAEADALIDSWRDPAHPISKHLKLAVVAAFHRRRRGLPPLGDHEPVPGCDCEHCTGIPRVNSAGGVSTKIAARPASSREPLDVTHARAMPILDVAERLGLGKPRRVGRGHLVCCPLHEDTRPSLRLNPIRNQWYCFPCGVGGDGIRLVEQARRCSFVEAVRFLK